MVRKPSKKPRALRKWKTDDRRLISTCRCATRATNHDRDPYVVENERSTTADRQCITQAGNEGRHRHPSVYLCLKGLPQLRLLPSIRLRFQFHLRLPPEPSPSTPAPSDDNEFDTPIDPELLSYPPLDDPTLLQHTHTQRLKR